MADYSQQKKTDYNTISGNYSKYNTEYKTDVNNAYDIGAKNTLKQFDDKKAGLTKKYQSAYDANAIQQMITQRQAAESMANMGLAGSGLAKVQQKASTEQRKYADASLNQLQRNEQTTIDNQKSVYQDNLASQKAITAANSDYQLKNTNEALNNSLTQYYNSLTREDKHIADSNARQDAQIAASNARQDKQIADSNARQDAQIAAGNKRDDTSIANQKKFNEAMNRIHQSGQVTAADAAITGMKVGKYPRY